MIKIKLKITQHLRDYYPIFGGHVHPHQKNGRNKIHPHYLRHHQHDYIGTFTRGNFIEKLKQTHFKQPCSAHKISYTLVKVRSNPRIEVTTIHPIKKKDTCCDQKITSISKPIQWTAISIPRVTGSFLPTRSNTILIVHYKHK